MGLSDATVAELRELGPGDVTPALRAIMSRAGHARVQMELNAIRGEAEDTDPFATGLICASHLPAPEPIGRIWFGVYVACLTLFVGETGAGKSSILYNLAVHAARNGELYGVPFGLGRPVRTLFVDPENSGSYRVQPPSGGLCAARLERIGAGRPKDLWFHDGLGVDLRSAQHCSALGELIRYHRIDLVVLDPISALFRTEDENDNAEASAQMNTLRELTRATGAAIVAVHHTGKGGVQAPGMASHYGRGASARLALADVGMILRARGPDSDIDDTYGGSPRARSDVVRLHIAKDRIGAFGTTSLYLQMIGRDQFEGVSIDAWRNARRTLGAGSFGQGETAERAIEDALEQRGTMTRPEVIAFAKETGIGQRRADEALKALRADGRIVAKPGPRGSLTFELAPDPFA